MKSRINKKYIFLSLFLIIIIFLPFYLSSLTFKTVPTAKKGVLDLSNWNFDEDGIIPLDGE